MSSGPVMIMAGGTGGHVFPGLAVAEALSARHCPVVWLGTRQGLEARIVTRHGIEMHWISIAGVRGRGLIALLVAPFKLATAIVQALRVLRRCRPSVVLGMGGFVAGPGGIAAWLSRRPLLIHEQNAVAGTTNRLLARFSVRIFEAFAGSFGAGVSTELIGNPIRSSIAELQPHTARAPGEPLRLLVVGGSQGARALNRVLPQAMRELEPGIRPQIKHQAGRDADDVAAIYAEAGITAEVIEFIDDMAAAYAWADVVVARAGALTIAELSAAGLAAILVPYPYAIDDHQRRNAEQFVAAGAGVLLLESELSPTALAAALRQCLESRERLAAMGRAARAQARPDAASRLADACMAYTGATT